MTQADDVSFLCTPDSGGSVKAWRVVVKGAGQVWPPKSKCRLVPLEEETADGWTHRLHVPRWLVERTPALAAALNTRDEKPTQAPPTSAPKSRTCPRPLPPPGVGSGPTAMVLYVERKVARLAEHDAAALLGLPLHVYRQLELGEVDFSHADELPRAVSAFHAQHRRRTDSR